MGKTEGQKLEEKLCFKPKHIAKDKPKEIEKAREIGVGYKTWLGNVYSIVSPWRKKRDTSRLDAG